ncbi:MAG TPA: peptidylprolyl isomerase [Burkholderiales bacterium]|nr:peptidylprolyl isomerase [Burkholderiales bacterium]
MNRTLIFVVLVAAAAPAAGQFRAPTNPLGTPGAAGEPQWPPAKPAAPALRSAPARGPVLIDRIVAIVNKDVITQRDLDERVALVVSQLKRQNTPLPPADVLERQVLERMISDRVQVQYALETGVRVDDLQLDRTVAMIAEQNRMSLADFRRALDREGVAFDKFREDIRREIMISRLKEREVDSKIQIGESEIDNFLAEVQSTPQGVEYDVAHILVRVPESATPEQIEARMKRAEEARARVQGGTDFAQVAVSYSDAPDALAGGGMGWRAQDRLPELFATALAKMKPGDVSPVLRSAAGFHVLKLVDRRGGLAGGQFVVEQTHPRHILVKINEIVSESEARRRIGLLRQRIVDGAKFDEVARLNSDDTVSAQRGGDLGWVVPGDLLPDFERAMNELKVNEVSQPVRTTFGIHLIQVLERRTADVSVDRKRVEARKVLRDRRADETYQEWLRQLRDRAYVELRLDER